MMVTDGSYKKGTLFFLIAVTSMFMIFWTVWKSDKFNYMKDLANGIIDVANTGKIEKGHHTLVNITEDTGKKEKGCHTLLNITEEKLMGWTAKGYANVHEKRLQNSNKLRTVLWFNRPYWVPTIDEMNKHTKKCRFNNCYYTDDKGMIKNSSAIIFTIPSGLPKHPPLKLLERPRDQVWIYFGIESPATVKRYTMPIPQWKNSFNWSMSYQFDSDIVLPYGYLNKREFVQQRNFSDIYRRKTKWATWLVSKCNTPSLRKQFVTKLTKHGLTVDIFGRCGKPLKQDPKEIIDKQYKFYLSFENSMCKDYITEKFFKYFNYDVILVVRGGANYKQLLPPDTFIDTADFNNFKDLVDYLKEVGSNETLYTSFLRNKQKYISVYDLNEIYLTYCALCAKLNHLDVYKKTYEQIPKNLEQCYTPGDV